jgi:hypothetical protein
MLCQRCQAPIVRGSLAAKTRHGHILHATCYKSLRPHAGSYPSTNMNAHRPPQPRGYPPTQPPPIRHQTRHHPPPPPRLYRQYPVQTAPTPRSVSDSSELSNISGHSELSVKSQISDSPPPPSPPIMPLEGGGLTPFNLKLEGGGHSPSSSSSPSFEIDVFMK